MPVSIRYVKIFKGDNNIHAVYTQFIALYAMELFHCNYWYLHKMITTV